MTLANLIMLGFGLVAFAVGVALVARRGGSEQAVYARRIGGIMALSLGVILAIFAVGLRGVRS
jgi:hypothetical protein